MKIDFPVIAPNFAQFETCHGHACAVIWLDSCDKWNENKWGRSRNAVMHFHVLTSAIPCAGISLWMGWNWRFHYWNQNFHVLHRICISMCGNRLFQVLELAFKCAGTGISSSGNAISLCWNPRGYVLESVSSCVEISNFMWCCWHFPLLKLALAIDEIGNCWNWHICELELTCLGISMYWTWHFYMLEEGFWVLKVATLELAFSCAGIGISCARIGISLCCNWHFPVLELTFPCDGIGASLCWNCHFPVLELAFPCAGIGISMCWNWHFTMLELARPSQLVQRM